MKKTLIIELDGLSHYHLLEALEKKKMPFLKRLLKKNLQVYEFFSDLPSTSPTNQAALMYGQNIGCPGFTFIDRDSRRIIDFKEPADVLYFEDKYLKQGGMLKGGSSISNIFSGGANKTVITTSNINRRSSKNSPNNFINYIKAITSPIIMARMFGRTVVEGSIELYEIIIGRIIDLLIGAPHVASLTTMLDRTFFNIFLKEASIQSCIYDMKKGVPIIYLNLQDYDKIAHFRGPGSRSAKWTLALIDTDLRKIMSKKPDDYQLFLLSDHGQVDSIPFTYKYGMSFFDFVSKQVKQDVELIDEDEPRGLKLAAYKNLLQLLNKTTKYVYSPLGYLFRPIIKMLRGTIKLLSVEYREYIGKKIIKKEGIYMATADTNNDNLCHLYLQTGKQPLNVSQIRKAHPHLIERIVKHPAISIILGFENDTVKVYDKTNSLIIKNNKKIKGKLNLSKYGDETALLRLFYNFRKYKNCGDLLIFSGLDKNDFITFGKLKGSHGGFGRNQERAFFIGPKGIKNPPTTPTEIHKYIKKSISA